jgi:serine/threonine-protein kinase ATR
MARHPSTLNRATAHPNTSTMKTRPNNEAPPPSTLAAQIVQNQTHAATTSNNNTKTSSQQNGEKATFSGLLHEILHNPSATPETDLGVNVQLISVVVEAGLTVLTREDPFAQLEVLVPQAIDSLAVVEATIVRQADVLFARISEGGPPLVVWLVARLLPLCWREKCTDLDVAGLINSAVRAVGRSKLWRSAEGMRELVRDCVNGWLNCVEIPLIAYHAYNVDRHPRRSRDSKHTCW